MKSKIIITYILGHLCYYIGHGASLILDYKDSYFLASVYQDFMRYSVELDDWCGKDVVWERVEK